MPAARQLELESRDEKEKVVQWRRDKLGVAGYDESAAVALAERLDVDLHRAIELLRLGCPADMALRILL